MPDRSDAITSGAGTDAGGESPGSSARGGAFAGVAASGTGLATAVGLLGAVGLPGAVGLDLAAGFAAAFGLATVLGFACADVLAVDSMVPAVVGGAGTGDTNSVCDGRRATAGLIGAGGNGSLIDVPTDSAAGVSAGTSTTRRSGASIRRSRQGKPKPGSPPP